MKPNASIFWRKTLPFALSCGLILWGGSFLYLALTSPPDILRGNPILEAARARGEVLALRGVTVIPMQGERLLPDQVVLISGGRIQALGARGSLPIPQGARVVEAQGLYLLPGLTDMHAHLWHSPDDLLLYLANGVTTIRNMGGNESPWWKPHRGVRSHLALRESIRRGDLLAPHLFTTSPLLEDPHSPFFPHFSDNWRGVETPVQARRAVDEFRARGYDAVKIYVSLNEETYLAVVAAARQAGLPVVGHVPDSRPLNLILQNGEMHTIEHLSGYVSPYAGSRLPPGQAAPYARLTAQSGVWNTPMLVVWHTMLPPELRPQLDSRPEMRYVHRHVHADWEYDEEELDAQVAGDPRFHYPDDMVQPFYDMVLALQQAGAGLLTGTDAGSEGVIPGFSLHEELGYLVEAGLTPYQALRAATVNAALALGQADSGIVAPGMRADLLLLEANPLEDIANTRRIAAVVLDGVYLSRADLDALLEQVAAAYGNP